MPFAATRLLLVLSILAPACSCLVVAESPAAVEVVRLDVGFEGRYKVGVWVPVRVVLKSDRETTGEVQLVVPDGDGVPSTIREPADAPRLLRADTEAVVELYARFGRVRGWLEVRFVDQDGTRTVRRFETASDSSGPDTFREAIPTRRRLFLKLGAGTIGLEQALKSAVFEEEEGAVLIRVETAESLPTIWFGYEGVDTLVIAPGEEAIGTALAGDSIRVEAIRQWIAMGGKTVVLVGEQGESLLGERSSLAALLPGRFESTASIRRTGAYEAYCGSEKPIPLSRRQTVVLKVPKLVDVRGKVEAREGDVPLVIRAPEGFGTLTFAACDPGVSPWSEWVDRSKFLRALLGRAEREKSELGELRAVMHYGYDDMTGQLRASLDQFEGVRFAPFSLIILLLVLYILLIGPADYFFARKVARWVRVTWITFPAVVLLTCSLGYWLSYRFKGDEVRINQANVIDVDVRTGLVRGTAWANVFSPAMRRYDLEFVSRPLEHDGARFGESYTAWLGLPGSGIGGMDPRANPVFWRQGYAFSPALEEMDDVPIAVWSSKSITARWRDVTEVIPQGTFVRDAQTLSGSFTNTADYPLQDCILAFERWVYRLGDVAPGATVEVGTGTERSELKSLLNERKLVKDAKKDSYQQEATPYDRGSLDPFYVLRLMLFFGAGGGEDYTGLQNNYQPFLDMSTLIELDRAVLFAKVPPETAGAVLRLDGRLMEDVQTGRLSLRRFVFPVTGGTAE